VNGMPIRIAERDVRGSISSRSIASGRADGETLGSRTIGPAFLAAEDAAHAAWRRGKGTK
jgi:hypothetical protein